VIETKFTALLKSLTLKELVRFRKFLASPIFNEEALYIKLYDFILPQLKANKIESLDRKKLKAKLFPREPFGNQDYARLFSNFSRKIESFLVFEKQRKNTIGGLTTLLEVLNERELVKYFPDLHNYTKKVKLRTALLDSEYYLQQFKIDAQQNLFLEIRQQRTTDKNLLQTLRSLDEFYIINKLRYCAAMLHYKSFLAMQGEVAFLNEILAYLGKKAFDDVPLINIYRQIIFCFTQSENEEHYEQLTELIYQHQKNIGQQILKDVYSFAMVYCISMINYGKMEYQRRLFELYERALPLGLMLKKGEMSPWDFKNITTVALRVGENKWTLNFINVYKNFVSEAERRNAYTFNLARYYFFERKFDKVLPLLQDVAYTDIFYQLDSKTTLMKTYYELGEYLPLMALKESFRILLRRKKLISDQNRVNYMNFIRFTMKLYRIDVKDRKKLEGLKSAIEKATNVADKGWLVEKINELWA
jgi:hypothetical protein